MFERLIEYLKELSEEEIHAVDLESIAIADALLESHPPESSSYKKIEFIKELKKKWLQSKAYVVNEKNPSRTQLLLRKILDKMIMEGIPSLNRDELDILISVERLITSDDTKPHFERLLTLFSRSKALLAKRRKELVISPGLKKLDNYITYISSRDIIAKPICNVSEFGHIELNLRGHFFSHRGDLKILDTVPDTGIVSVENGSCVISGHVLGHVYASNAVEVLENISGTVVTAENDIRGKNAINRSFLVSKWGNVNLVKAEEPNLVFAGKKITILESTHLGIFASPEIEIGGNCVGGEFSVSKSLKAEHFSETSTRKLIVEIQSNVSCDWYGGLVPKGAERIISEIHSIINRMENIRNLTHIAFDECEHYAANGLIYLMGGDSLMNQIESVGRAHRRLAFLNRIMNGIDVISEAATHKIRSQSKPSFELNSIKQYLGGLRDIDDELKNMRLEEGLDTDLSEETTDLQAVTTTLNKNNAIESNVVQRLKEKMTFWSSERSELTKTIEESEEALRKLIGNVELLESSDDSGTKVTIFGKILRKAQSLPPSATLMKRSRSTFTQIIIRSVENRKNHIKAYKNILTQLADQYKLLCSDLKRNYHMPAPQEIEEKESQSDPFISGEFDENVILCTQKFLIPNDILVQRSSQPAAIPGVHVVKATSQGSRTYVLVDDEFHEAAPTS